MGYKPTYTWPNPAFPFRIYYSGEACRIFIIENIQHNWIWLNAYHKKIKDSDIFFVYCGWYHSEDFAREAEEIFAELSLKKENFFFMYNCQEEMQNFTKYGFIGDIINQNAWLDENITMEIMENEIKIYDAIYVARLSAFKRHYLASNVSNLALVAGINHGRPLIENVPKHIYKNEAPLTPAGVCQKINQSRCGLILSETEGACFSSSEYLLCGVPVVSTYSHGGRDVWYDEYNSLVVPPDPDAVSDAVHFFKNNPRDPYKIRADHIAKARQYRSKFIDLLGVFFREYGVSIDPRQYFEDNFFHKLRRSHIPDFDSIFG